jgi:hypothetical protein
MTCEELLDQAIALFQRRGRVTYDAPEASALPAALS